MNFKSNAAYKKWLAYGHASGEFAKTPGNQPVSIKGQSHKVKHGMGGNMYAAGGSFNNKGFKSLPANVQQKIKQNSMGMGGTMPVQNPYNMNVFTDGIAQNFAFGGNMRSYAAGGMLDNQLTEFNNGGRHEENPIGGIPQGFAPGGQVNLVEQGETKLNSANYIFSDTLKVTKDIALDYGLSKDTVGKTFAEVSKKLNRPTSRRENDTIEEVAKQRDLDNLMQAQEDFKQRDLQKDIDMMAEKHPEFMQQMMGQGQQQVMDQQLMNQGVPPEQLMQMQGGMPPEMMQTPQSVQPMGMPQGMPVDPNQIPPEMLAQMPEAQMGQPVMAYGGHMYKCGGKMYNFGGNMYAKGGVLRGIGAAAYGAGEGLLDTLTFGLTDSITDKGFDALSNIGNRSPEEIEKEKMLRGFANTAGAVTGGVLSGGAAMGSAISEGSEGLGQGVTNIAGTGEKFDNIANTVANIGSMAGSFVGNPTDAAKNVKVPEFANKIMGAAKNENLKKIPGVLDAVSGVVGQGIQNNQTMNQMQEQQMMNQPRIVTGYNIAPTPMQMKYGGYKAQAPWHNFPQYTPNYPGNAGPMYMGLGTNLFANGGFTDPPGPGDPPKSTSTDGTTVLPEVNITTGPSLIDNPVFDRQMKEYMSTLPYKTKYKGWNEQGEAGRESDLTRLATPKETENYINYLKQQQEQLLNHYRIKKQYGNLSDEDYNNFLATYNYFPTKVYTPAIPEGEAADYYENPANLNKYFWSGSYPKPSKQITDPFAITETPAPVEPEKKLAYVYTDARTYGADAGAENFRALDMGIDPATGQPAPMFRLVNPDIPGQAHMNMQTVLPRGSNYAEVQQKLYEDWNKRQQEAMQNFGTSVLAKNDPNYMSSDYTSAFNYYIDNPQILQEEYNKYINNPEWIESLSPEDKAKYLVPDYSNIPLYASEAGEEMYVPLRTGDKTWRYKGQEYGYDPTLSGFDQTFKIPLSEPFTSDTTGNTYDYIYQTGDKVSYSDPNEVLTHRKGGPMRLNTMYSPDLTYAAKMGGRLYNYGGGLKSPLMPLPADNFIRYDNGGKIVQGAGSDPYQYKLENGKYYTAKKGSTSWLEIAPTNKAYTAVKSLIDAAPSDFKDIMEANILAEQTGEFELPPLVENNAKVLPDVQITAAKEEALNDMQTAETPQEYLDAVEKYKSILAKESEKLTNANADLSMKQGIGSGLAMAIPAAYNLGAGIFGKAQQLDPKDYMIPEDITPYEYNINPQLSAANQTYAQAQDAFRNASMGGGDYMANMQQLANSRNQTIGELYTNKQNLDAAQIQAAKTANKEIQTANLARQMEIEEFNRLSKAAKQGLLQAGITQLADIGKNAESKKLDLAYIKAVAPELSGNISYSSLGEQFLEFLKKQKELTSTSTSNKTE
jgi:hypothetical protein